ncbi:MAG: tetratricopeptide repeat protein, partial [Elainellaceae cyanobacterium]
GTIYLQQGQLEAAIGAFRQAAESNSNYPNAYYGAGLAFMQQGKYADARQVLEYAQDLFSAQGNPEWAANAERLMQQAQSQL